MPKKVLGSICLVAAIGFVSCEPPKSQNPLSDPKGAKADLRLAGLWAGHMNKDVDYIVFAPREDQMMDLVLIGQDSKDGAFTMHYEFYPTTIDGKDYMNLRSKFFPDPDSEKFVLSPTFFFARYEISKDGILSLWPMSDDEVKKAITNEKLEGNVDAIPMITADSAKLSEFIKNADPEELFWFMGKYKKAVIDLPSTEK